LRSELRSLRPNLDLVTKFCAASVVPILVIGVVLTFFLNDLNNDRTVEEAKRSARLVAEVGIAQHLGGGAIEDAVDAETRDALSRSLNTGRLSGVDINDLQIWSPAKRLIYTSEERLNAPSPHEFVPIEAALGGQIRIVKEDNYQLTVFTPLLGGAASPRGVVEVTLPYRHLVQQSRKDLWSLYVVLFGGCIILFGSLYRLFASASRTLERRAREKEHQALHDPLTGLANRVLFQDRLQQALRLGGREKHGVAVMIMDLDRFKEINDTLGHQSGDFVLKEAARRLESSLRETDTIARLGGDEFALLLPNVPDPAVCLNVADKISHTLNQPFLVQGLTLDVRASIGIAMFPDHGKDSQTLVQRADIAMYLAKSARSVVEVYASERDQYSPSRLALVGEMREALDQKEFVLHYQPKVSLKTGHIGGVEALIRWEHPLRALVPPDEFIPLAEHTGLIEPITRFVLDVALRDCSNWRENGIELPVAVNISARTLLDEDFPDQVSQALRRWQIPPSYLQLEITESTLLSDPKRALGVLSRLSQMGVELSIDDFGTGYSSLSHLRRLPLKELKIDKSFVQNMAVDENDLVIVRSTIDLGRNLGLQVVAEGVETSEVWKKLQALGCDYAQGFYNSRPMPAAELVRWLMVTGVQVDQMASA
jgi:diguanylate cyclase (GGDEF)-like protein